MELLEGLRWRKQVLKPIVTKRTREAGEGEAMMINGEVTAEPLSPSARMFHEPHFNCYIIAIMGCKTRINPHVVKAGLEHTLLKHPRFSSIQVVDEKGGEMKWVQTKVDLENHVIVPDLDPNMDSPDQFVEDYVSDLTKTTIEMSKPLWDLHLLNVRTAEAEAVGVFRIHHSLGDGTSLISLLLACTRKTSDPEALPTIPSKKKAGSGNSVRVWWRFFSIWWAFRLLWNTFVDILMFVVTSVFLKDTETPLKGAPGVEFTPKRFVHRTVSLDDIKLVKKAMNTTINDVVLAVTQSGLSRYLNRRYGEGKKDKGATEKRNNLPKNICLRSTLLINMRPSAGIQDLADMMKKDTDAKWGNWIGYVLLPFTIALRDDPLDYVHEAKVTIDRKKLSLESVFTFSSAELFLRLFGIKTAAAISHKILSHTTMSFSNVVGPLEEIGFYGHPMAYLAPTVYGHPHALTINFQSYINKMKIVLAVDQDAVPDPHQLCDDLEESLKLIKDAIIARGLIKDDVEASG
ncbi:hypothetical protein HHK36_029150 [Tetracentron sinense]|uniref:Diacylglycerol O-acyltransferase n=1 Tax=Tetracentron sinense TaxID=13715 RepID=A0A835D3A9_TETSI|nr:hypothetical protein HHK36_029150 [Tetracentron sinense]